MEQKKTSEQNRKEKSFSEQLVESIANKPFTAEHWQQLPTHFPKTSNDNENK